MEYEELLRLVADDPVFESSLLLAGEVNPAALRVQLSRWVKGGRLYALRRGLYALAPPYQKVIPHPFAVANRLSPGSYVSLQSALAHHGVIPEYVAITTSVGAMRPARWETPLGTYTVQHIRPALLWGYTCLELGGGQHAFVATPEKALLDLVHLQPGADRPAYLAELRLNYGRLDMGKLQQMAQRAASPKLLRAARIVARLAQVESEYEEQ